MGTTSKSVRARLRDRSPGNPVERSFDGGSGRRRTSPLCRSESLGKGAVDHVAFRRPLGRDTVAAVPRRIVALLGRALPSAAFALLPSSRVRDPPARACRSGEAVRESPDQRAPPILASRPLLVSMPRAFAAV